MARNKPQRHGPLITLKDAIQKYQRPRWWFCYYRVHFTPVDVTALDLSPRFTYLYEDEIQVFLTKRPYQPRQMVA